MTNKNDLAFPAKVSWGEKGVFGEPVIAERMSAGLTKREYFASMFLQGLISKYSLQKPEDQDLVSKVAVELADTFIKALND